MSIVEATEAKFGPIFPADLTFNVEYPGPRIAKSFSGIPKHLPTFLELAINQEKIEN
jgi:hypothetical protein